MVVNDLGKSNKPFMHGRILMFLASKIPRIFHCEAQSILMEGYMHGQSNPQTRGGRGMVACKLRHRDHVPLTQNMKMLINSPCLVKLQSYHQ